MLTAAKDAIASKSAQLFLNERIRRYGKIERLQLDSANKQLEVVCALQGEPAPVVVNVDGYLLESIGGKTFITISDCTCSRPWLQNLLVDYVAGRRFEVPRWVVSAL